MQYKLYNNMAEDVKDEVKKIKKEISILNNGLIKCEQHLRTLTKEVSSLEKTLRELIKINEKNNDFTEKLFNHFEKSKNESLLEELVDTFNK